MAVDLGSPRFIIYRSQKAVIIERGIIFMGRNVVQFCLTRCAQLLESRKEAEQRGKV